MRKFLKVLHYIIAWTFPLLIVLFLYNSELLDLFITWFILLFLVVIVSLLYDARSPRIKVNAVIIKRPRFSFSGVATEVITFLLPNGNRLKLAVYKGKFSTIKVGDSVILEYKGNWIKSMKKTKPAQSKNNV